MSTGEKLYGLLLKMCSQLLVELGTGGLGVYVEVKPLHVAISSATTAQCLIELDSVCL